MNKGVCIIIKDVLTSSIENIEVNYEDYKRVV